MDVSSPAPISAVSAPPSPSKTSLPSPPIIRSASRPPWTTRPGASASSPVPSIRSIPASALITSVSRPLSALSMRSVGARPVTLARPPIRGPRSRRPRRSRSLSRSSAPSAAPRSAFIRRTSVAAGRSSPAGQLRPRDIDLLTSSTSMTMLPTSLRKRAGRRCRGVEVLGRPGSVEHEHIAPGPAFDDVTSIPRCQTNVSRPKPRNARSAPPFPSTRSSSPPPGGLRGGSAEQRVVARLAVHGRLLGVGEDAVRLVDANAVLATAGEDLDPVEPVSLERPVRAAVVAEVELEAVGVARTEPKRETTVVAVALDDQRSCSGLRRERVVVGRRGVGQSTNRARRMAAAAAARRPSVWFTVLAFPVISGSLFEVARGCRDVPTEKQDPIAAAIPTARQP